MPQVTKYKDQRDERFKALDRMRDAFKDVPASELEAEVEKSISAVRAEGQTMGRRKSE